MIQNLQSGVVSILVKAFLALDLLFTTLMFLFPISEALEKEIFSRREIAQVNIWLRNFVRSLVVILIAAIAYFIPFFELLTGLTGGFGNNILGFILPPLFYVKLNFKV